jgi:hypothetical protein
MKPFIGLYRLGEFVLRLCLWLAVAWCNCGHRCGAPKPPRFAPFKLPLQFVAYYANAFLNRCVNLFFAWLRYCFNPLHEIFENFVDTEPRCRRLAKRQHFRFT